MDQSLINWMFTGFGFILGFILKVIWQALKDLQTADKDLSDKVASIEVLVAGDYVRQDRFDQVIDRLFKKLDHIEEKLDGKVDRA